MKTILIILLINGSLAFGETIYYQSPTFQPDTIQPVTNTDVTQVQQGAWQEGKIVPPSSFRAQGNTGPVYSVPTFQEGRIVPMQVIR